MRTAKIDSTARPLRAATRQKGDENLTDVALYCILAKWSRELAANFWLRIHVACAGLLLHDEID